MFESLLREMNINRNPSRIPWMPQLPMGRLGEESFEIISLGKISWAKYRLKRFKNGPTSVDSDPRFG